MPGLMRASRASVGEHHHPCSVGCLAVEHPADLRSVATEREKERERERERERGVRKRERERWVGQLQGHAGCLCLANLNGLGLSLMERGRGSVRLSASLVVNSHATLHCSLTPQVSQCHRSTILGRTDRAGASALMK